MAEKKVRPWDLFNKKMGRVSNEIYKNRIEICQNCSELIKTTFQCKKCGCFMKQKCKLADSSCPINKWNAVNIEEVLNNE